ncbi:MAG: helix-turn-helix domain-containing protein [Blastocatellia bacterium]
MKNAKVKKLPAENKIEIKPIESENLTKLLEETRKRLGLAATDMAVLLNTTDRSYRRWESGESDPSGQAIAKIYVLRSYYPEYFKDDNRIERGNFNGDWKRDLAVELGKQQQILVKELAEALLQNQNKPQENKENKPQENKENKENKESKVLEQNKILEQNRLQEQNQKLPQPQYQNLIKAQYQIEANLKGKFADVNEMDKMWQRVSKLEKRLVFLEEKCGYPYQPPQYENTYRRGR